MRPWIRLDDGKTVTHAGHYDVIHKRFRTNEDVEMVADTTSREQFEAVVIVPLTERNTIVIARQFRCGPELVLDELPGGMVDPGETHRQAALRELMEETGSEAVPLTYLGKYFVNPWSNATHHVYLAMGVHADSAKLNLDPNESIELDEISIEQLIENARSARMTDAAAVMLATEELMKIKEAHHEATN